MSRVRFALAAVVVALFAAPDGARAADPAAAKTLTPDAIGFVHVRVGDIWSADAAKQLRAFTEQAGPGMLADFDSRFVPAPSDIESFKVVLYDTNFRDILPMGRTTDVTPVWVIASKKPLDRAELLKTMANGGKMRKHNGKEYIFDETYWAGVLILDDRTYAYASEDSITALIDRMAKGGESSLATILTREHDKHPVTMGVNPSTFAKPELLKEVPEALHPLFKAQAWVATLDLKPKTLVAFAVDFGTEAQAKDGLKSAQEGVQMTRGLIAEALTFVEKKSKREPGKPPVGIQEFPQAVGLLLAASGLKQLDGLLGKMPLEVNGTAVRGSLELDGIIPGGSTVVSVGVVAIAIGYAIGSSERTDGSNITPGNYEWTDRERNMTALAKAVDKYRADKGHYPPPAMLDKDGKPTLSWRVAILPYMENAYINVPYPEKGINSPKALYDMFKLDEPWDGPNNKKLIGYLPSPYRAPYSVLSYNASSTGKTTVMAVVGKGAIFDPTKQVTDTSVRDGLAQTLLLISLEESNQAVYWTKPLDINLTAEGKLPAGAPNIAKRFGAVYADGSARTLATGLDEKTFLGIVTRDGAEKLDEKVIRPEPVKPPSSPPK